MSDPLLHFYLLDYPQAEIFGNVGSIFEQVAQAHTLSPGDFPNAERFVVTFGTYNFENYTPVDPRLIHVVDQLLVKDLPLLMKMLPTEAECRAWSDEALSAEPTKAPDPELEELRTALAGPGQGWEFCDASLSDSGRRQLEKSCEFCTLCGKQFGMRNARQHCRACGVVSCKECSDELPNSPDAKARWCYGCKACAAV